VFSIQLHSNISGDEEVGKDSDQRRRRPFKTVIYAANTLICPANGPRCGLALGLPRQQHAVALTARGNGCFYADFQ